MGPFPERRGLRQLGGDRLLNQHWPITAELDITPLMSRHRRERVPRHRAQRSAGYPARRARVTAAVQAAETAPDGAGDAEVALEAAGAPVARPAGRPVPSHSRRRNLRAPSTATGSEAPSAPAAKHPGVVRGLLVTPWFATATGFVIAVSLWIYSPHPQLAYPAIAIGKAPCSSSGCKTRVDQQGAGSLTMNSGEPVTQQHKPAAPARAGTRTPASTAASGLTFGYVARQAAQGKFLLIVSVTGERITKNWRLSFVLPGDHIEFVIGAHWQAAGSDGGTASPLAGDQGQQRGGAGDYGGGSGDQRYGGAPHQSGVRFTVVASGSSPVPAHCSYDGASCTFRELSSASQGRRG
jgi:hypothetical protein